MWWKQCPFFMVKNPSACPTTGLRLSSDETYFFQEVCSQHQDFGIRTKALDSTKISHSLLVIFGRRHDFEYMKRGPRHIVANHFQIYELQQSRCFDVCSPRLSAHSCSTTLVGGSWKTNPYLDSEPRRDILSSSSGYTPSRYPCGFSDL